MGIILKHTCSLSPLDYLGVKAEDRLILIHGVCQGSEVEVYLDIPTAIRFSKTIRTEINKVKEGTND